MKKSVNRIILAALVLAVCIPFVSAWSVENYRVDPSGTLSQKSPVKVSFSVDFPVDASNMTFPVGNDLVMTTGLAKPAWSYTIITEDGGSSTTPAFYNQTLDLSGLLLSYRGHGDEVLSVTLTGTAPVMSSPGQITVLDIHEVDKTGKVVAGSGAPRTANISDIVWTPATTLQTTAPQQEIPKQAGLWDQIVGMVKSLFGITS